MKLKSWLAVLGTAAVIGGVLIAGIPAAKAQAAGGPPAWAGRLAVQSGEQGFGIGLGRINGGMLNAVAEFLGIDVSNIIAERQSGKSMVQIAQDNGKSEQELVDYIVGQRSEQIEKLVEDGRITREQADLHKQFMTERVSTNLNRTDLGPNRPDGEGRGAYGQGFKGGHGKGMGAGLGRGAGIGQGMGAGFGARAGLCPYYNNQAQ